MDMNGAPMNDEKQMDMNMMKEQMGGRRHKGSKKMHKGKRHGNASLRAWVTFVKKVQREEGVGYKEAMTLAKKRKDKGEKWRGGAPDDLPVKVAEDVLNYDDMAELEAAEDDAEMTSTGVAESVLAEDKMEGGRRRRRRGTKKRRGSKKRRGTKKRRGSRRRRH